MTSIAFDTLDASATLRAAGLDEGVARAIVQVVSRTADLPDISKLATKGDIDRIDKRIDGLERLIFASIAFNLTGFVAMGGLLYAVLK